MSRDLMKENKGLLLKIDKLVGEEEFDTLENIGENLINNEEHPSLLMSFYIFRFSWPIPDDLKKRLEDIFDELKNEKKEEKRKS
jgi:hypothetical protein